MLLVKYERLLVRAPHMYRKFTSCKNAIGSQSLTVDSSSCAPHLLQVKFKSAQLLRLLSKSATNYFCDSSNVEKVIIGKETIDYTEFEKLREDKSALIIDVRNPDELLKNGKIPNAINIPLSFVPSYFFGEKVEEFEEEFGSPLPTQTDPIIVFCKAGIRGEMARKLLTTGSGKNVYTNVACYQGSFDDWSEKRSSNVPHEK